MMTKCDIENKANEVLNKYVQKGGAYKQFDKIFTAENIKYRQIDTDENKFCGVFTKAPNGQKYIILNSNISISGRKNFTLAHELGHYYLGHQFKSGMLIDTSINEGFTHKDPIESEADYFASCLLMPAEKITSAVKSIYGRLINNSEPTMPIKIITHGPNYKSWAIICDELTKRYGVSEAALRCRLSILNIVKFIN